MKSKKILAGALAAVMVTAAAPLSVSVSAAEYSVGDRFFVDIDDDANNKVLDDASDMMFLGACLECTVLSDSTIGVNTYSGGNYLLYGFGDLVIPSKINGFTVTNMTSFSFCAFTSITIPDTVTSLDEGAFYISDNLQIKDADTTNTYLEKIVLGKNSQLKSIGKNAFKKCPNLKSITIPASVTEIGDGAFADCTDLTISGYAGSYAETYAKANGITFVDLSGGSSAPAETTPAETTPAGSTTTPPAAEPAVSVEDKDTGVTVAAAKGVLEEGTELVVKPETVAAGATGAAFDISLEKGGKAVKPNGAVTVTIPVPEALAGAKKYYVFYKAADGTLTDMKASFADGKVTFDTTHFSTYIVSTVDLLADKGSPSTGIEGVAVIAGLAIIASAALVISKKRK